MTAAANPWPGLWALVVGFFMILVDATIVNVANPAIMAGLGLGGDYGGVIWVTSAYLLAYAVPLLVTGRLGDRFGPRRVYLIGLVVFTASSAWCGFAGILPGGGLGMLIAARVFQGFGASLMSPQTMAIITRTFPPDRRGAAMGVWGSVAGVATLIGPMLGGLLVDLLGWEWIFFVNVPVGLVAAILAWRLVPRLDTHPHRFDLVGVALSTTGLFMLVFGLQEGETYQWGQIAGPITVWGLIATGAGVLAAFVLWQARTAAEPLVPLGLFAERNFSLANVAIAAVGFAVTCLALPLMFYLQSVRGLTPTQSALMIAPSAILSAIAAPLVGRSIGIISARLIAVTGLGTYIATLLVYAWLLRPDTPIGWLLVPNALMGLGMAGVWGPISTTATRGLPLHQAGAGSGVYNTTRQVGAVVGSASVAALIQARLTANLPPGATASLGGAAGTRLPAEIHDAFSRAMAEALLLPAGVAVVALVAASFFTGTGGRSAPRNLT